MRTKLLAPAKRELIWFLVAFVVGLMVSAPLSCVTILYDYLTHIGSPTLCSGLAPWSVNSGWGEAVLVAFAFGAVSVSLRLLFARLSAPR